MMMRRAVILLTLLISFGLPAVWRLSTRAAPAAGIPSLAVMSLVPERENVLYAGVRGGSGVYRTGNNGANWNAYSDKLGSFDVVSMSYRDNVLYAGTWGKGVYYRSSGMSAWALSSALDSGYNYVRAMSCDSAGNLFAADPDLAIYRLESSSQTSWQRLASTNLPGSDSILCLFSDSDNRLYAGLLKRGVYSYVPGSSYYNGHWEAVGSLSGVEARVMIEGPGGKIWLATNAGIRCLENGQWAGPLAGAEGLYVTALLRNPDMADQVLLGTNNGEVYSYSAQQGAALISGLGIPAGKRVWSLAVGQNGRLFAGTAEGLYYADGAIATPTPLPPTATPTMTATPTRTATPTITRTPTATSTPPQGFWEIIALPLTRK